MPPQTSCPPCALTFPTRLALRTHIRHSASHPACLPCHRRFLDQHSLAAHRAQSQFHSSRRLSATTATTTAAAKTRNRRRRRYKRGLGARGDGIKDCGTETAASAAVVVVANGYEISGRKYLSPRSERGCVNDVKRGESKSQGRRGSETETEKNCSAPSSSSSSSSSSSGVGLKKKNHPHRFWRLARRTNPPPPLVRGRRLHALPRPLSAKRIVSGAVLVAVRCWFPVVVVGGGVLMVWIVFWRGGGGRREVGWVGM